MTDISDYIGQSTLFRPMHHFIDNLRIFFACFPLNNYFSNL
ncbi:hypothetical protein PROSTU_03202 [Providencia stuartii ATCC 25827]|uniref:Uncharacterized protein n=1 Tax=Providencia stuartii ATCC 25827 TaxID=471874 RepID=A0AA86YN76_PROST|nr:hypothetical protein PROSTU_03202 [Providencia stuartii ATCC 25827]